MHINKFPLIFLAQATFCIFFTLTYSENAFSIDKNNFELIGKSEVKFKPLGMTIYNVSFFRGRNGSRIIELEYAREVKSRYSKMGWKKSLRHLINDKESEKAFGWIISNTPNFNAGDIFSILINKNSVKLFLNSDLMSEVNNKNVAELVHYPWIGEKPIDENIKDRLMGN